MRVESRISTKVYIPGHYEKIRVTDVVVDGWWQVYQNDEKTWDERVSLVWSIKDQRWTHITASVNRCIRTNVPGYEIFDATTL